MIDFNQQKELLELVGRQLRKRTEALLIGGSAMMFHGAKAATFDIDLVFMDKNHFLRFADALGSIGFSENKQFEIFRHYETAKIKPKIFLGSDTRFDLFLNEVVCFKITDSILSRIKEEHEFGNLIVKIVAPEDIILLKCATERAKDRVDAAELARKYRIDWKVVISESILQMNVGKAVYPVFLLSFLHELRDKLKVDIPDSILAELEAVCEKALKMK
ncbi:MAG TPA: hypothetical protein HA224_01155 [Nanoarchaeota archaeon]|nr:hypothetical protein [Nanoarchaeota archaeon]